MSSINEAFGRVIVNLRKARNQSQEDFAWVLNLNVGSISRLENIKNCNIMEVKIKQESLLDGDFSFKTTEEEL